MVDYQFSNLIQKCLPDKKENSKIYPYPVDSLFLAFLKTSKIVNDYAGINGLEKLYSEYEDDNKSLFNVKELVDDMWIRIDFGEWSPAINWFNEEHLKFIKDDKLRSVISFLDFISCKKNEIKSKVLINDIDKIIEQFRILFPNTPSVDELVEKRLLSKIGGNYFTEPEDRTCFKEINKALAQYWTYNVDCCSNEQKKEWLELAFSCNATFELLFFLEADKKSELLKFIIEMFEKEEWVDDIGKERNFIIHAQLAESINTLAENSYDETIDYEPIYRKYTGYRFLPDDIVEYLYQREHFTSRSLFMFHIESRLKFLSDLLIVQFETIPADYKDRGAEIVSKLHLLGHFINDGYIVFTADSLVAMFMTEKLAFFSFCQLCYLCKDFAQNKEQYKELFKTAFRKILGYHYCNADIEQISLIASYLINKCCFLQSALIPSSTVDFSYQELFVLFIDEVISVTNFTEYMIRLIKDFDKLLTDKTESHVKSRGLGGLLLIAQRICSKGNDGYSGIYRNLLKSLNNFYQAVCAADSESLKIGMPDDYWTQPVWFDVYKIANESEQKNYKTPISFAKVHDLYHKASPKIDSRKPEESEHSGKIDIRVTTSVKSLTLKQVAQERKERKEYKEHPENTSYKIWSEAVKRGKIQTGILCAIVKKAKMYLPQTSSELRYLTVALYSCLISYHYDDFFNIFKENSEYNTKLLKEVGGIIEDTDGGWKKFEDSLTLEKALIWRMVTKEEETVKSLDKKIQEFLNNDDFEPICDNFSLSEQLILVILNYKYEKLYGWSLSKLKEWDKHLDRFKDQTMVADKRRHIQSLINRVNLLMNKFDEIRQGDDKFFKVIADLAENEMNFNEENSNRVCIDFGKMEKEIKDNNGYMGFRNPKMLSLNENLLPLVYINWLYAYIVLLQNTKQNKKKFELYWKQSAELIERVSPQINNWCAEHKESYLQRVEFRKELNKSCLSELKDITDLRYLKILASDFEKLLSKKHQESVFQKFFEENSLLLTFFTGSPFVQFKDQAYVGGKSFDNCNGQYPDFLRKHIITNNTFLVEIKTPATLLLENNPYRLGIYPPSKDLSGAVSQFLTQKYQLETNMSSSIHNAEDREVEAYNVQGLVIIGCLSSLDNKQKKRSFELYRNNQKSLRIVAYDECLELLKYFVDSLSKAVTQKDNSCRIKDCHGRN